MVRGVITKSEADGIEVILWRSSQGVMCFLRTGEIGGWFPWGRACGSLLCAPSDPHWGKVQVTAPEISS